MVRSWPRTFHYRHHQLVVGRLVLRQKHAQLVRFVGGRGRGFLRLRLRFQRGGRVHHDLNGQTNAEGAAFALAALH